MYSSSENPTEIMIPNHLFNQWLHFSPHAKSTNVYAAWKQIKFSLLSTLVFGNQRGHGKSYDDPYTYKAWFHGFKDMVMVITLLLGK